MEDDKSILEHTIVQLKSTVKILDEKLCKTEGELNEMNDQHVNENRTISKLKQLSETVGELNKMHVQDVDSVAIFLSKFKSRNRILKDEGANLNKGKH